MTRWTRTTALALLFSLAGALAARGDDATEETRDRELCRRAEAGPYALASAVDQVTKKSRRVALAARFALDATDRLHLRVTTVGALEGADDFEEVSGPVSGEGWVLARRSLSSPAEVAEAARCQLLLSRTEVTLRKALASMTDAQPGGGAARGPVLSLRPRLRDGRPVLEGLQVVEGLPWDVLLDLDSGQHVKAEPPAYERARREKARQRVGKALPALAAEAGRWLNVDSPPTLEGWRGVPVFVLVTDFT